MSITSYFTPAVIYLAFTPVTHLRFYAYHLHVDLAKHVLTQTFLGDWKQWKLKTENWLKYEIKYSKTDQWYSVHEWPYLESLQPIT